VTITLLDPLDCTNCTFEVNATDSRCEFALPPAAPRATETFVLEVDSTPVDVGCGFFTVQNPYHVSEGFDPFGDISPGYPEKVGNSTLLHIDHGKAGELVNVKFWYQFGDVGDEPVPANIRILSNEQVLREKIVYILEREDEPEMVQRADIYLEPFTCATRGASGSDVCLREGEDDISTRIYDIEISTVDAAGNKSSQTCSVVIIPPGHYASSKSSKATPKSTKAFQKRKLKKSMDGTINKVPAAPEDVPAEEDDRPKSSKGSKACNGSRVGHDPNDLRDEYNLSTKRTVLAKAFLIWDPMMNSTLNVPPLPPYDPPCGQGKSGKIIKGMSP